MTEPAGSETPITNDLDGKVHVRHYPLDLAFEKFAECSAILDKVELERAHRFRFEKHQRRFIVARATLRTILARYADCAPQSICFGYGEYGKPFITGPSHVRDLKFSVSHSSGMGAVAITLRAELGLDIEQLRVGKDYDLIVSREFSAEEKKRVDTTPLSYRAAAFLEIWTCKEAYLKGIGTGLTAPMSHFSIAHDPSGRPRLAWSDIDSLDPQRWSLHRMNIDPHFIGCLALYGERCPILSAPWRSE